MDSKVLEKAGSKLIDELPQYKSKKNRNTRVAGQETNRKGLRLPLVQIIGPILIACVGIAVIQLSWDKSPPDIVRDDPKESNASVTQPKVIGQLASPSGRPNVQGTFSPGSGAVMPPDSRKAVAQEKSSVVHSNSVQQKTITREIAKKAPGMDAASLISRISAVVCQGVQSHQPMDEKQVFLTANNQRAYVWMEVHSKSQPFEVQHRYYLNNQEHHVVPLNIKYPRMRTWSYLTIDKPDHIGDWRVEIVHNDNILKTVTFQVNPGEK